MAKIELPNVSSGYNLQIINDNFQKIEEELQSKVLYRNNPTGEPNTLETDLDVNSKRLINLPLPISDSEPLRVAELKLFTSNILGGYIRSDVGAVLRTLLDKVGDIVNIKDFGAVGDGITDDTNAIQAAINSGAKGIQFTGAGPYIISSELQLYNNDVTLWSKDNTVLKIKGGITSNINLVRVRGSRISFIGITFDGNNTSPPLSGDNNSVNIDTNSGTIDGVLFSHCTFQNFNGYGIYAFNPGTLKKVKFSFCTFTDFTNNLATPKGVIQLVQPVTSDCVVLGCQFENCTGVGVGIRSSAGIGGVDNCTIADNVFRNNAYTYTSMGVEIWGGSNVVVSGNTFRDSRMGISLVSGDNWSIAGNSFKNQTSYSIEVAGVTGLSCAGNAFHQFSEAALFFDRSSTDVSITGNTFRSPTGLASDNKGWAVTLSTSDVSWNYTRLVIADNVLNDCTGLRLDAVTDVTVSGNILNSDSATNTPRIQFTTSTVKNAVVRGNTLRTSVDSFSASTGAVMLNGTNLLVEGNTFISTTASPNIGPAVGNVASSTVVGCIVRDNYMENYSNAVNLNQSPTSSAETRVYRNINKNCTAEVSAPSGSMIFRRDVLHSTTAPTAGTYRVGDVSYNPTPNGTAGIVGWICTAAGTPGTWVPFATVGQQQSITTFGDADATLTPTANRGKSLFSTPLTANRTVTLSTTNAWNGSTFKVIRSATATGAFNLDVGGLKTLTAESQWAEVTYNGTSWVLTGYGTL